MLLQSPSQQHEQQYSSTGHNRRDLGKDDDLQIQFDRGDHEMQDKQLNDKILFSIQGFGSVKSIPQEHGKAIDAYIKGEHCQQSIKDLIKVLRFDVPDNPKAKLILTQFNIIESDLIQLLLLQVQDKKLSFWLIALLALMTTKPSDDLNEEDKQKLYIALREYKNSFIRSEVMTILTMHIAEYFKTEKAKRQKAHYQMLQFIIILIRNLLQIPDLITEASSNNLHNHFLSSLIKEEMFNPLLYLVQNQKGEMMDKIDIPLLEIFYYTFTCFDPSLIYKSNKPLNFSKLAAEQKLRKGPIPVRHSRFLPNFMETADCGVRRITHHLSKQIQPVLNQRQVPRRVADLKLVKKIEQRFFDQNFMEIEHDVPNHETGESQPRKLGEIIAQIAQQFVQIQLPQLSEIVFNQIYKQNAKVASQNVIQYLLLCNWAIKMTRSQFLHRKSNASTPVEAQQIQFQLSQIATIMQVPHFQLIYKTLFRQATRQKKKQFKVNTFNAALKLFQNYLNVINDISMSFRPSDRNNANILMGNMFRHDIARIFKIGFLQITHEGILQTLISVCYKFYKLLSRYANGKVLTIQTNKLLKRKNKKKVDDEQDMNQFISEDSGDDSDGSRSYHQGQQQKQRVKPMKKFQKKQKKPIIQQRQPMFQQRKFNQISQFAIIAEYDIISKYLSFIKGEKILNNTDQFNDAVFFYFEQIVKLLKGQWLFYQAQTLCIFQSILSIQHQLLQKNKKNNQKIRFIKLVCKQFIQLMKVNKLALVQSLFHYPNLSVKQKIMRNYQDGEYENQGDFQKNMFDQEDDQ